MSKINGFTLCSDAVDRMHPQLFNFRGCQLLPHDRTPATGVSFTYALEDCHHGPSQLFEFVHQLNAVALT